MDNRPLDLDAVRAFVRIMELGGFTRAAESLGTTQSAVSLKLRRLEERLGCRLVERTPRYVRASPAGAMFLDHARNLLESHDRACASFQATRTRLSIGLSDHVAGPDLPSLIARMHARNSDLLMEIRIGSSNDLLKSYDRRELDAALVRFDEGRGDGRVIAEEALGWFAGPFWRPRAGESLPVATMPAPCGVRVLSGRLLDEADVPWTEAFVGGGVAAVSAAVMAGLGVAALARRMLPLGAVDVGARLRLPELPRLPIVLHSRVGDGPPRDALLELGAAFRSVVQK